jgi:hypothetical protein
MPLDTSYADLRYWLFPASGGVLGRLFSPVEQHYWIAERSSQNKIPDVRLR